MKRKQKGYKWDERIQPPFAWRHPFSMSKVEREARKSLWRKELKLRKRK